MDPTPGLQAAAELLKAASWQAEKGRMSQLQWKKAKLLLLVLRMASA